MVLQFSVTRTELLLAQNLSRSGKIQLLSYQSGFIYVLLRMPGVPLATMHDCSGAGSLTSLASLFVAINLSLFQATACISCTSYITLLTIRPCILLLLTLLCLISRFFKNFPSLTILFTQSFHLLSILLNFFLFLSSGTLTLLSKSIISVVFVLSRRHGLQQLPSLLHLHMSRPSV
ncbi:hypothetical protein ES708_24375 [subsurface metagenome]